jgi:hypothetical protein
MSTQFTMWLAPAGGPDVSMSVRPDERAHVYCHAYRDRTPILSISHNGLSVTITPDGQDSADEANLRFAQNLADAAATYLAEVERFTTESTDSAGPGDSAGSSGAAGVA